MSRPVLEPVPVKAGNDIYTGLLAVAFVAVVIGLVIIFVRAKELFPNPLWSNG